MLTCFTSFRLCTHLEQHLGNSCLQQKWVKQMHYDWGQAAGKRGKWLLWAVHIKQKRQCSATLTVVVWNDNMAVYIASSKSWKKVYSRTITKFIPLLHREHGFCQQNGPEGGQALDWYLNEKMVVIPVISNGLCCYSEVIGSLPFLAFRGNVDNAIFGIWHMSGRIPPCPT